MDIRDFSKLTRSNVESYCFGLKTSDEVATALEKLAADIRSHKLAVKRAEIYERADIDDFALKSFGITFVEKHHPVDGIYGPDSLLPVELVPTEVPVEAK